MGKLAGWRDKVWQVRLRITPAVLWDAGMINLAFLNLFLLCFDFTYLWLRPSYLELVPFVVRLYDPVKGIDPDPLVARYLEKVDDLEAASTQAAREAALGQLLAMGDEISRYEPLLRSGQFRELKIDDGVHRDILRAVVSRRREVIARTLADALRRTVGAEAFRRDAKQFLDANLERAADSQGLCRVPLPKAVVQPLVGAIGRAVFDATVETLGETLESPQGRRVLEEMLGDAVDALVEELTAGELEALANEITQDGLEQMKATVTVREWLQPPD